MLLGLFNRSEGLALTTITGVVVSRGRNIDLMAIVLSSTSESLGKADAVIAVGRLLSKTRAANIPLNAFFIQILLLFWISRKHTFLEVYI